MRLNWQTIIPSSDRRFTVKGHELNMAIVPGTFSRFAIYEVRSLDEDRSLNVTYWLRDAGKVTDDEVADGKRPPIVARNDDPEKLIAEAINLSRCSTRSQ
jgi:hypothetical protein